ncbi:hypothetical protein FI667_g6630, partial [Globisporangium splendens]
MPRVSRREKVLRGVRRAWAAAIQARDNGGSDDDGSSDDEEEMEWATLYLVLQSKRYVVPREHVERPESRLTHFLTKMDASEFQLHFRMSRRCFFLICAKIADHRELKSVFGKLQKPSVEVHLLILLKMCEASASNAVVADFFSCGKGTVGLLADRTIKALNALKDQVISWPNASERREIAERIEAASGLPQCVGFVDGTLFPLIFRPKLHSEDYYSAKEAVYAMNAMVLCDDQCRIRYENIGWPGSSHDNRVWGNCEIALNKERFFSEDEYILGDSAYQPSTILVPAFKKTSGVQLSEKEELFNDKSASARARVVRCIGMLKGRFPLLTALRTLLVSEKDARNTVDLVCACMVLHNLAIDDPIPETWVHAEGDVEDEESDEMPGNDSDKGEERRRSLCEHLINK